MPKVFNMKCMNKKIILLNMLSVTGKITFYHFLLQQKKTLTLYKEKKRRKEKNQNKIYYQRKNSLTSILCFP